MSYNLVCNSTSIFFVVQGRGASCMSHNGHATACPALAATACLITWLQLDSFFCCSCRRGRRCERWGPIACPTPGTQLHVFLTWLQLEFPFFVCTGRGASCMSHDGHATACLLAWSQLGIFFFVGGATLREMGPNCMPHTRHATACLLTWSQLHAL
jgi:hypothetical protein